MGAYSFSIDQTLLDTLSASNRFKNFVETGTFRGDTALLASQKFEKVWTVEASEKLFLEAKQRLCEIDNISLQLSDSPLWLSQICGGILRGSSVFWLDAHWCSADSTEGLSSQCPLLAELDAIGVLKPDDVILIDDARLYLTRPAPPHESSDWPTLTDILHKLQSISDNHEIRVINDVFIVYPPILRNIIDTYSDKYGVNLVDLIWKAKEYDLMAIEFARKQKTAVGKLKYWLKRIGSKSFKNG